MGNFDYTNWQMPAYNLYQPTMFGNDSLRNINNYMDFSAFQTAGNQYNMFSCFQGGSSLKTDSYNSSSSGSSTSSKSSSSQRQEKSQNTEQKLSNEEIKALKDYYAKNNILEEGFMGAATGGLSWMAFEHAQSFVHPLNAKEGFITAEGVFKNIPKEFAKKNSVLLQNAYTAVQQAKRDTCPKYPVSSWLRRPIGSIKEHKGDIKEIEKLINQMEKAIRGKNVDKIAECTAKLEGARGFDGKLFFWSKNRSVSERLADKLKPGKNGGLSEIMKRKEALLNTADGKITSLIKNAFLKHEFVGMMAMEMVANLGKIITASKKDLPTAAKQTAQSLGKSAFGAGGWCLGRAAGTWLGAKIGTFFCPGVGTAIGALVGFTVGSIGMWAGHKLGNLVCGDDVANEVEAEKLAQTEEGQQKLLEFAMQKEQEKINA